MKNHREIEKIMIIRPKIQKKLSFRRRRENGNVWTEMYRIVLKDKGVYCFESFQAC